MSKNNILILKRGEELISSIIDFCNKKGVSSAWFTGLGAGDKAILAFYDLENKKYIKKEVSNPFEITNILGNVAKKDDEIIIHCHATLSDEQMKCFGGHIDSLTISGTCEIIFTILEKPLIRNFNKDTGLNLLEK